jgi:hypothetical protein
MQLGNYFYLQINESLDKAKYYSLHCKEQVQQIFLFLHFYKQYRGFWLNTRERERESLEEEEIIRITSARIFNA